MDHHVSLEISGFYASVATLSAFEWFFSGVYQDVLLEATRCLASESTLCATEELFSQMSLQVSL